MDIFKKYHNKLVLEGLIKSIIISLICSFGLNVILSIIFYFQMVNEWWILIIVTTFVLISLTPVFYFLLFKPTELSTARRVDLLGLHERVITMKELENQDSYIIRLQREETKKELKLFNHTMMKLNIFIKPFIVAIVLVHLGLASTTITALSTYGILPGVTEVFPNIFSDDEDDIYNTYYSITYEAAEGGFIYGEMEQLVLYGEETVHVLAVADDGYMFYCWSDNYESPYRYDENVVEDAIYFAIFVEVGDGEGQSEGDGEGESEGENDDASDQPSDEEPSDNDNQSDSDSDSDGEGDGSGAGGGATDSNNQVIDGETDYRALYEEYYNQAMEILENGGELSPELIEIIEKYFDIIV